MISFLSIQSLIESGDVVKIISNKKEVLFYTDRPYNLRVHSSKIQCIKKKTIFNSFYHLEFVESWRKISVEGSDDNKIWKFLDDHGHFGIMKSAPRYTVCFDFVSIII